MTTITMNTTTTTTIMKKTSFAGPSSRHHYHHSLKCAALGMLVVVAISFFHVSSFAEHDTLANNLIVVAKDKNETAMKTTVTKSTTTRTTLANSIRASQVEDVVALLSLSSKGKLAVERASPLPRFLFGMLSTESDKEKVRRQVIRRTYLSVYHQDNDDLNKDDDIRRLRHRICTVHDLQNEIRTQQSTLLQRNCIFVYAFVVGGNPQGPTELMVHDDKNESSIPLTLPSSLVNPKDTDDEQEKEDDIVYLNIRENMNAGKSQTFFAYGASIADELGIEYIAKVDTDAVIWPHHFFDEMTKFNVTKDNNVATYGGFTYGKKERNYVKPFSPCPGNSKCPVKGYYMGAFYFVSTDLAKYVTGPYCPRQQLKYSTEATKKSGIVKKSFIQGTKDGAEDASFGNFVHSYTGHDKLRYITMGRMPYFITQLPAMTHPVKDPADFERYYHLRNLVDRCNNVIAHDPANDDISAAVCHKSLFGTIDLYSVIEWAVYHRLLGFDHIFMTYLKGVEKLRGFDELQALPFLTLNLNPDGEDIILTERSYLGKPGYHSLAGKCDQRCLVQRCLQQDARDYDWLLLTDADEFLWFNQTTSVKQFLMDHDDYNYLSFGKYMYSIKHAAPTSNSSSSHVRTSSGFYGENLPYRGPKYCARRTADGNVVEPCVSFPGLSKVMVRPSVFGVGKNHKYVQVHGHALSLDKYNNVTVKPQFAQTSIHFPMEHAHLKEWAGANGPDWPTPFVHPDATMASSTSTSDSSASSFTIRTEEELPFQGWESYTAGGEEGVAMTYDSHLKEWFGYVAQRGSLVLEEQ